MNKDIAIKWYKQALHDLEMAEKNIDIGGYDVSASLSHQAVEKLLKALLAFGGRRIPKIHHLDQLAETLGLNESLIEIVYDLTGDYIFTRYPDVSSFIPYEEYTKERALTKLKIAQRIFSELKSRWEKLEES